MNEIVSVLATTSHASWQLVRRSEDKSQTEALPPGPQYARSYRNED